MRSAGKVLAIVGGVLAALLATLLLGFAVGGAMFVRGMSYMVGDIASSPAGRGVFALLGSGLLAVDIWLVLRALGFGAARMIEFESSAGSMVVDVTALEEALRRRALEHEDVADAKASIRIPGGGLANPIICDVDVGISERADVPGRGAEIAETLRRGFLRIIPIETDPVVNLHIHIRPPAPCEGSDTATQAMAPVDADGEPLPPPPDQDEQPLPDVPDFTGERRYGKSEGDAKEGDVG